MIRVATVAMIVWLRMLRRKDAYVLLILLGTLLAVLSSLNVFGLESVARYVKDVGLLMAWFFGWLLAVNMTTRELPDEENRGTIFPLLAKPLTRFELIVGKWIGCWIAACGATLLFYLLVVGIVLLRGDTFQWLCLLQGSILHSAALGIICSLALAFSTRLHHDAAAAVTYVVTAAAFLVVPRAPELIAQQSGTAAAGLMFVYHAFPHFELLDLRKRIVHNYAPIEATVFFTVLTYALVLIALFLLLAWLGYRHKRFSRAQLMG